MVRPKSRGNRQLAELAREVSRGVRLVAALQAASQRTIEINAHPLASAVLKDLPTYPD